MRPGARILVCLALVAAGTIVPDSFAATQAPARECGLVGRFNGRLYDVRETKGAVPCRRVRSIVTKFFRTDAIRPARGWVCFRGHSGVPWAVSCAHGTRVIVRVYAPT